MLEVIPKTGARVGPGAAAAADPGGCPGLGQGARRRLRTACRGDDGPGVRCPGGDRLSPPTPHRRSRRRRRCRTTLPQSSHHTPLSTLHSPPSRDGPRGRQMNAFSIPPQPPAAAAYPRGLLSPCVSRGGAGVRGRGRGLGRGLGVGQDCVGVDEGGELGAEAVHGEAHDVVETPPDAAHQRPAQRLRAQGGAGGWGGGRGRDGHVSPEFAADSSRGLVPAPPPSSRSGPFGSGSDARMPAHERRRRGISRIRQRDTARATGEDAAQIGALAPVFHMRQPCPWGRRSGRRHARAPPTTARM